MKKITLLILSVFAIGAAARAQSVVVGIKGGASLSNVTIEEVRNDPWQYADAEQITGYHAGIFTRFQVAGVFLQPEALVASSGGKIEITDNQGGLPSVRTEELNFTRLDVPLLLGYNFFNVLRVQAGPVASMLLSAQQDGNTIDDYLDETDWGWQAGIGLDVARLTLDLRYERLNRNYTNEVRQNSYTLNNQQYLLSLGYKFIK